MTAITAPLTVPGSDLLGWLAGNLPAVRARLRDTGLIRLRGGTAEPADLPQRVIGLLGGQTMAEVFFSTPRSRVLEHTFTATEYPAWLTIAPHSEMSYLRRYPRLLCFQAVEPAQAGGQTTVVDLDAVSAELGELTAVLADRQVRYRRVFRDGVDIPLATAFGTDDPARMADLAAAQGMTLSHRPDGTALLEHRAQGTVTDPVDGRLIWFNQLHLNHPALLPRETRDNLSYLFGPDGLPRQVCYGDGGTIPDELAVRVATAFDQQVQPIDWQPGEVVVLDNLRWAHGRLPFQGRRSVRVAMGMPESGAVRLPLYQDGGR